MSYKLIYTVPFADIDNVPCVVEIEKENYIGSSIELIAGSSPFSVDIEDDDFLYVPTRFSTATIRVVGSDYLQSLFSTAYQQFRVTFKKNNIVYWCGFIKPEIYTQDYSSTTFELEIECISAMSSLEFIDFKQTTGVDPEKRIFISLWKLLKNSILASNGQYEAVCFPHVYASSKEKFPLPENVLESLTISEQNFFDEDDKPMKIKEVIEEICRFMQWTCVDRQGELYFVDIDHTGAYRKYDLTFSDIIEIISTPTISIQQTGFTGSGHSLDILPGYNKATVKCSNYSAGDNLPEEDFDKLEQFYENTEDYGSTRLAKQFFYPQKYKLISYIDTGEDGLFEVDIRNYVGNPKSLFGSVAMRYCLYDMYNSGGYLYPKISDYSWTNSLQCRTRDEARKYKYKPNTPILKITMMPLAYFDCAFSITGSRSATFKPDLAPNEKKISDIWDGFPAPFSFSLRIGNYYYNGTRFTTVPHIVDIPLENKEKQDFISIPDTKTLNTPYEGMKGYIISVNSFLYGDLEFILYAPAKDNNLATPYGYYFKDLKLNYQRKDDQTRKIKSDSDRLYENVVNQEYANELDEIELKISSYNNDGACYSKVLLGDNYLTDNLYSAIEDKTIRPEEQLIRRIIKRYSAPQIKLTQVIKAAADLTPITRLSDNYMVNKKFINAGGTIDYQMNQFTCIMIEV